jgi:hypothetical protein
VRLLGISLSQLDFIEPGDQLTIFDQDKVSKKRKSLNIALDSVQEKYGDKSIRPGTLVTK